MNRIIRTAGQLAGVAAGVYGGYVAATWLRYPRTPYRSGGSHTIDRFMPAFEVREVHQTPGAAPAAAALRCAREARLQHDPVIKALFGLRTLPARLRAAPTPAASGDGSFLGEALAVGWRILSETPGREIVIGSVTRPWESDVRFRGLPPDDFAQFDHPGYAKIVWTLEVDPVDAQSSVLRTETRVVTTDPESRRRFALYWSFLSPGIILIRHASLRAARRDAERLNGEC